MLLNRVKPKSKESLHSFLIRTAQANYYDSLACIMPDKGSKSIFYHANLNYFKDEALWQTELVQWMDLDQNINGFILNQFDDVLFDGSPTKLQQEQNYYQTRVKYCPLCLKEETYHRLYWDLSLVSICLEHHVFLIEQCPGCGKKISLSNLMKNSCQCGAVYSDAKNLIKPNDLVFTAQDVIQKLLLGNLTEVNVLGSDVLKRKEYFHLLDLFSILQDSVTSINVDSMETGLKVPQINYLLKSENPKDVQMSALISTIAHDLIVNPNHFFPKLLEEVEEMTRGPIKKFRYKRGVLKRIIEHEKGMIYRGLYQRYLTELKTTYVNKNRILKPSKQEKKYMTITETMKFLGSTHSGILRLCQLGKLKIYKTDKKNHEVSLIDRNSAEKWKREREELLSVHQAAEMLGLFHRRVQDLAIGGFIKAARGTNIDGHKKWLFAQEEIQKFIDRVLQYSEVVLSVSDDWVSFRDAVMKLRKTSIDQIQLISMMMEGFFKTMILKQKMNFQGLFFLKEDIEKYIGSFQQKRQQDIGYTTTEIASLMKVGNQKVLDWIKNGKLVVSSSMKNPNGTKSLFISKDQVENLFKENKEDDIFGK